MKLLAIKTLSRSSIVAITAHQLMYSPTAAAATSFSVRVPAFSFRHRVSSSLPLSCVSNGVQTSSVPRHTTSALSVLKNTSWLNSQRDQKRQLSSCIYQTPLRIGSTCLFASPDANESPTEDKSTNIEEESSLVKDAQNIIALVGAQGLLIPISIMLANFLDLPNRGLGESFLISNIAFVDGVRWTIPLFVLAGVMKLIEPYSPALQDVTKATQRSVLAVMGPKRRPIFAILVSILLGAVAGWGEEWLFRGVFQTQLGRLFGNEIALAVSGLVFGLLHAVTPVYAMLAGAASVFFGYLYNTSNNLAVPMVCHAVYDVGALLWAHYSVTALSKDEQQKILEGGPGAPILSATNSNEAK